MFKVLKLVFNCGVVFTTAVLSKIDFSSGIGSQSNISIVLELSAWPELLTSFALTSVQSSGVKVPRFLSPIIATIRLVKIIFTTDRAMLFAGVVLSLGFSN